jgi:hypothetical protein
MLGSHILKLFDSLRIALSGKDRREIARFGGVDCSQPGWSFRSVGENERNAIAIAN